MASEPILADIRVLDLSEGIAGPFCTKLFASLGAEVIKVERPGCGDPTRAAGPFLADEPHPEKSAAFLYLNTGKKSVTLNLDSSAGQTILRRLAQDCDILVEAFPPGYLDALDLGYPHLRSLKPDLIYTSLSPFGQTGPYRRYKGSEIVAQALGGLMYTIGVPGREPLKIGGNVALHTTGIAAFSATMLALQVRDVQGFGQHVDVSSMETTAMSQIHASIHYQFRGTDTVRRESTLLRAADGWVTPGLGIGTTEDVWQRLCDLMGKPELAGDERFITREARREHQQEMQSVIAEWAATLPKEEIYHALQRMRTIAGYVATVEDLAKSEQLLHREFFQTIDHPFTGEATYPGTPFTVEGERGHMARAPLLGEHNVEVYCGRLGYCKEDLVHLSAMNVI
ncbi:MAG TPA: CoA transferase [Thermoleophilia bacterium]|nr:CoA transferase [Thermoleophilia bacterium]